MAAKKATSGRAAAFEKSKMDRAVDKATGLKEGSKGDRAVDRTVMAQTNFGGKQSARQPTPKNRPGTGKAPKGKGSKRG